MSGTVFRASLSVACTAFVGLFVYEATKTAMLPSLTLWQSHFVTIVFGSMMSGVAAFYVLRAQARLHAKVLSEASERIRAEAAVTHSAAGERRYRGLVEGLPAAIVVHRNGYILFVNPACMALLEAPLERPLDNKSLLSYIDERDRDMATEPINAFGGGPASRVPTEYLIRTLKGNSLAIEATSVGITHDGAPAVQTVLRDVTEQRRLESALYHQAFHDALTGLANRALFRDRVEHALATGRRAVSDHHAGIAVLFIDLDHFKHINDAHGHAIGDALLQAVAGRMLSATRGCDTVARLGGDEFAVVLEQMAGAESADIVANRILAELHASFDIEGRQLGIGASIGIAGGSLALDVETLLRNADLALYSAKMQGRQRAVTFAPHMHTAALQRVELESDLRAAVLDPELAGFSLVYQPIIDLTSSDVVGMEALLRWNHPWRGMVPPTTVIPIAEESGLIVTLGKWVFNAACRQLAEWRSSVPDAAHADLAVCVNLSARQLQDTNIVSDVAAVLAVHDVPPACLVLEITESVMMHDPVLTIERLRGLKRLGVRLAIDDFGTGYSSLSYLRQFPVDIIKIDKSFIEGLGRGGDETVITTAIVSLGKSLALRVVAEGIEDETQLSRLLELGCEQGQGYLFSKPVPPHEFESVMRARCEMRS